MKVEMCKWYEWSSGPTCKKGRRASIKCHSKRPGCPDYEESESKWENVKK